MKTICPVCKCEGDFDHIKIIGDFNARICPKCGVLFMDKEMLAIIEEET